MGLRSLPSQTVLGFWDLLTYQIPLNLDSQGSKTTPVTLLCLWNTAAGHSPGATLERQELCKAGTTDG